MNRDLKEAKLLCFSTTNHLWFVRLSDEMALETSIKTHPIIKLPNWCLGVVVVGGDVATVIDLEGLIDSENTTSAQGFTEKVFTPNKSVLLLKKNHKIALSIKSLLGLQNIEAFQSHKMTDTEQNPLLRQSFKNENGDIYYHFDTSIFIHLFETACHAHLSRGATRDPRDKNQTELVMPQ